MDYSLETSKLPIIFILCLILILHSDSVNTLISDNERLIYSHCPNQTSPDSSHFPLLSTLFQHFIAQSSKSRFFETIVGDEKIAISGSFQCRNDLSSDECATCVSKFPVLSNDLCGKNIPARIQLSGCYAHYFLENGDETEAGFPPVHVACSKDKKIKKRGFEEMKYAAFEALENCVTSRNGFCEMMYESFRVLGQCGGRLRSCGCGDCVNTALHLARQECSYSVSGEIYLDSCYISYEHYKGRGFGTFIEGGDSSAKLVAIVVGGLAVLSLGIGLCYFLISCGKKKKNDW